MALIVETITATSMADLRAGRDRSHHADMVELRLDGVKDVDVAGALAGRRLPVLVTCRPSWEGGRFDGSEEERLGLLGSAIRAGAEFVDVEWKADRAHLPLPGRTELVLSHHEFSGTPPDLDARIADMRAAHSGCIKIAVTASRLSDVVRLRDAVAHDANHVAIAMGPAGALSRVWPAGFNSRWTYGGSAAPGQLPVEHLSRSFRAGETTPRTAVYGIVGAPLAHSASPAMHNAAFLEAGVDAVYVPLETCDPDEALSVAHAFDIQGLSVTAPLKTALASRVTVTGDVAQRVGAVNTLRRTRDGWEGENFDVGGFLDPLNRHAPRLRGQSAVVLGAGGAARAAVWALKGLGVRVTVCARQEEQAANLAREFGAATASWPPDPGWSLLVNTTPVGTFPDVSELPIPTSLIRGGLVYDLVYNPPETALILAARAAGAETISGVEMLMAQARRQFAWWTGRVAAPAAIERAAWAWIRGRHA